MTTHPDQILRIGNSFLHHGPLSDRVYLMSLDLSDLAVVIKAMRDVALQNGYGKLFAKIGEQAKEPFSKAGFFVEAEIPDFEVDGQSVLFMSKFLKTQREEESNKNFIDHVLKTSLLKQGQLSLEPLSDELQIMELDKEDCLEMSLLFKKVFKTYPFPVFDPKYLAKTMDENIRYFGIRNKGRLIAMAAGEIDGAGVEMTDFTTDPAWRKSGLAGHLLRKIEKNMIEEGLKTGFSISRAVSYGANILFAKCGYAFGGILLNNTNIAGEIESMNIWYKKLNTC